MMIQQGKTSTNPNLSYLLIVHYTILHYIRIFAGEEARHDEGSARGNNHEQEEHREGLYPSLEKKKITAEGMLPRVERSALGLDPN